MELAIKVVDETWILQSLSAGKILPPYGFFTQGHSFNSNSTASASTNDMGELIKALARRDDSQIYQTLHREVRSRLKLKKPQLTQSSFRISPQLSGKRCAK